MSQPSSQCDLRPFHTAALRAVARLSALVAATTLAACGMMPDAPTFGLMNHGQPSAAIARLAPTSGSTVEGEVRFTEHGSDTLVEINLRHLSPGAHGFHVHEKGDCSAADALSAGGHFNPDGQPHGAPETAHHRGDLGNVTAGADGTVNVNFHVKNLALTGDDSIVGRALIVHAAPDDLATQPSGNSGKRLACGIVVRN